MITASPGTENGASWCDRAPSGLSLGYIAQARWRRLDGAHLLPLVGADILFVDGVQQEGKVSKTRARVA
jgi:hypothetical protein